jgi:Skp family chaperone for outer membrane proteins
MKTTVVALSCLIVAVVLLAGGWAGGSKAGIPTPGPQIGVVRIVETLQVLAKARKHADEIMADRNQAHAELQALAREIETEEAELAGLKATSSDHLRQSEALAEKKAHFSAHKDFLDRQLLLKQQSWTQKTYGEIVRVVREVAVEKGLPLVLVKDDPNVPGLEAVSALIATQKVIYCGGCPDITQEVQARLIAAKP